MTKAIIKLLSDFGSKHMRVLEAVAPCVGTAAPTAHAEFIGQTFVDTTNKKTYTAVATDSATAANDWIQTGGAT